MVWRYINLLWGDVKGHCPEVDLSKFKRSNICLQNLQKYELESQRLLIKALLGKYWKTNISSNLLFSPEYFLDDYNDGVALGGCER